ncbi:MAG: sulfur carrier protein [bacterium]|jgi:sulfur carrier protein
MKIYVHDEETQIEEDTNIDTLIDILNLTARKKGIALAVNENVIPKTEWDQFRFQESDKVLIIQAIRGG